MTVCIAAVGGFQNAVIVAVDQMLTLGSVTGDLPEFSTGMRVHPRWYAMYSGDVKQAPQILGRATNLLGSYKAPRVERVTDIFLKVYNDHRKRILGQGATEFEIDFLVAGFDSNGAARIFQLGRQVSKADMSCKVFGLSVSVATLQWRTCCAGNIRRFNR